MYISAVVCDAWFIDYSSFDVHVLLNDLSLTLHMKTSALPVKDCKIYAHGLWERRDLYRATLLWHGASVFLVSSDGPPHSVASYNTQWDVENLFNSDPHGSHSVASYDTQGDAKDLFLLESSRIGLRRWFIIWWFMTFILKSFNIMYIYILPVLLLLYELANFITWHNWISVHRAMSH
jgi:hypothetical protein